MERDIWYEIKSLKNEFIRRNFKKRPDFNHSMISPVQMQIIDFLLKNQDKDIYQKDLETLLNVRKSTISGIVNTMVKNNILKRINSDEDRRNKKIVFTEEAMLKHKEIKAYFKSMGKNITKNIPKEKLDIFFEVIDKMRENIIIESEDKNDKNI